MQRFAGVLALLWLLVAAPVAAQQDAKSLLPDAAAFGDGWTTLGTVPVNVSRQPFMQDGVIALYGGPNGARIKIELYVVSDGADARRSAWELGDKRLDVETTNNLVLDEDTGTTPPSDSDGCVQARRIAGFERWTGFLRGGLILCQAAPNLLFLVYTSGPIADREGSDAAGWVAGFITGMRASA